MAKWTRADDMPQDWQDLLKKVRKRKEASEAARRPYLDKANTYYGLYRNYRKLVASRPDEDSLERAKREWGAELFIPYCFATIETMLPRVLANDPEMKVKPRAEAARTSVDGIAKLFSSRQADIGYQLRLQPIVRSGLKYGLGVGKFPWEDRKKDVKRLEPRVYGNGMKEADRTVTLSEGPTLDYVDIFDFFWDPSAWNMDDCDYAIHRMFRSNEYVIDKLKNGSWKKAKIDLEHVEKMGSDTKARDQHKERMESAGVQDYATKGEKKHEVWEYHDCDQVVTVLDNEFVVEVKEQGFHRELPFGIYRPTIQEGEFWGIGAIEPIAHLQFELNTMRSQRRDMATLVLQKSFFFAAGRMEEEDLVIGPGVGIPVWGNPRDIIQPIEFGELPGSSYQEEAALKDDIERTAGISDSVAGAGGDQEATATGTQLVQQAANIRIQQMIKNLEVEFITRNARIWLDDWRQHTFNPREIRVEDETVPGGYRFDQVTPEDLSMDVEVIPTSGSTEPENVPQQRNDAMVLKNQLGGDPHVDQQKLIGYVLEKFGVQNAETWLVPEDPKVDPNMLGQFLVEQVGMPDDQALAAVQQLLQASGAVDGVAGQDDGRRPEEGVQEGPPEQGPEQGAE